MTLKCFLLDHKRYLGNTKIPGTVDEWHTDNGTEFVDNNIDEYCQEIGSCRSMLPPYTPTRNASAERIWGIVLRSVAKMIAHAGKDNKKLSLWPYGMAQAIFVFTMIFLVLLTLVQYRILIALHCVATCTVGTEYMHRCVGTCITMRV